MMIIHTIKRGDTIYGIGRRYNVSPQKIIADNQIKDPRRLMVGQAVVVQTGTVRHRVDFGETLYFIARRYGTTVERILEANPNIFDPSLILAGQFITIPAGENLGTIEVNGFAFPDITPETLEATLPHLTYISIFSYQVRPDGSLIPVTNPVSAQDVSRTAVAPVMVITNIKEGESFDSDLAHTILNSEEVQENLIGNVTSTLQNNLYKGLDVDFEYIYPQDRDAYTRFIRKLADRLHPLGYFLSVSIAPKISGGQEGLLYEAHDYPALGRIVDHVIIMTYEWGYTFGPAQAVAPIDQVEKVLAYAVSVIPSEKILMGMPNYGYDWTLPFTEGSAAQSLSNTEAIELASRVGAEIQYDQTSQAPFFTYYSKDGRRHIVWFDDARSIKARLKLVDQYSLGGVSYWTVNNLFKPNWIVLDSMYNVRKLG